MWKQKENSKVVEYVGLINKIWDFGGQSEKSKSHITQTNETFEYKIQR